MAERRYILLKLDSTGPGEEDFRFASEAMSEPIRSLQVETMSESDAADARREPGRLVAEPFPAKLVAPVSTSESAAPPAPGVAWGVQAVGAVESPYTGANIKIAVLDTGIDASHEAFQGLTITARDFTGEGDGDVNGHGTHCAGTIAGRDIGGYRYGIAPGMGELLVGKVLGREGGSTEWIAQGILWALDCGASIISMSLGMDFPGRVAHLTEQGFPIQPATSRALEAYRDNLRLFGALASYIGATGPFGYSALVVAASGNESRRADANPYTIGVAPPAGSEGFIAVGALQRPPSGQVAVADFSNTGATVAAPGVDILSAKAGGGWVQMSGTSMATPHVAGVAALWAESLLASTGQIDLGLLKSRVLGNADELAGEEAADVGAGLIQAPR